MAATCRDVVKAALRKLGVADPRQEPTADQGRDALESLKSLYAEWLTSGAFGTLYQTATAVDVVAKPGQAILKTADVVVTLPTILTEDTDCECRYDYGFIHCDPRLMDMAVVTVASTLNTDIEQWLYSAQTARWVRIDTLELSDIAPLTDRGSDGLAALLAVRIADDYGVSPSAFTLKAALNFQTSVVTRLGQRPGISYGAYF